MGCGLGQGYLVARPMTPRGIEDLAAAEPAGRSGDGDERDGYDDSPDRDDAPGHDGSADYGGSPGRVEPGRRDRSPASGAGPVPAPAPGPGPAGAAAAGSGAGPGAGLRAGAGAQGGDPAWPAGPVAIS
jgi:hypothetical protein